MAINALLSEKAIAEFQAIYKEVYGVELGYQEALSKAIRLLQTFRQIYKPIKKESQKET